MWIAWHQLWIALAGTLALAFFHFFTPWSIKHWKTDNRVFASFAGGVAVAFVFLHMLPELVEHNEPIGHLLARLHWLSPLGDLAIFVAALFGFMMYYGLEIIAEKKGQQKDSSEALVYRLHVGTFCLYNFLITYTMTLRVATGLFFSLIFIIATALHFILIDRKFGRLYPHRFSHSGRFVLVAALLIGWLVSVIFDPVNVLIAALMTAFLAGSMLLNVFREELPSANKTSYLGFISGAGLITIILLAQAFLVPA